MAFEDPVFVGILVAIAAFFFFLYLFVRRIATGFREGYQRGRNDR